MGCAATGRRERPCVGDLHGQALDSGIEGGPLWHSPGDHDAVDLEPQVVVVGGRRVFLDDEDAGADPANRELLMPLHAGLFRLDRIDARARRSVVQEGNQLLQRRPLALGVQHDRAGLAVAHPAVDGQLTGARNRRLAEADALDIAMDDSSYRGLGYCEPPTRSAHAWRHGTGPTRPTHALPRNTKAALARGRLPQS